MNKLIAIAIAGVLAGGAAFGAYQSGLIGGPYAEVVQAKPVTIQEDLYGEVVSATPVTAQTQATRAVCRDEQVQVRQPERFGDKDGMVAGAVIGGLLGHSVGKGDGRTLATVAGAVGGGYAGREIDRRHNGGKVVTETRQVCHDETGPVTTTIGYDVQYRADGQLLSKRVVKKPDERIWLGVRDKVIGYDVTWRYRDQSGTVRMDHDPGDRLPMQDGAIVVSGQDGSPSG